MVAVRELAIAGAYEAVPDVHRDDRGLVVESYRREWIPGAREAVQANRADRSAGCVVGLHFHHHQADYWYVVSGTARLVLHDLRVGSPSAGVSVQLDVEGGVDHRGLHIPTGVAHGFASLTDVTLTYLVDRTYDPSDELAVRWNDPAVAVDWGVDEPILSQRDLTSPFIDELADDVRPRWTGGT